MNACELALGSVEDTPPIQQPTQHVNFYACLGPKESSFLAASFMSSSEAMAPAGSCSSASASLRLGVTRWERGNRRALQRTEGNKAVKRHGLHMVVDSEGHAVKVVEGERSSSAACSATPSLTPRPQSDRAARRHISTVLQGVAVDCDSLLAAMAYMSFDARDSLE